MDLCDTALANALNSVDFSGYGFLLKFLQFSGLNIKQCKMEKTSTCSVKTFLKELPIVFMYMVQIYIIISALLTVTQSLSYIVIVASFTVANLISLILWHLMYRRKRKIMNLLIQFNKITVLFKRYRKSLSTSINISLGFVVLVPAFSATLCAIQLRNSPHFLRAYYHLYLESKLRSETSFLLGIAIADLTFWSLFAFPSIIAVACGTIYYRFSELLSYFCDNIMENDERSLSYIKFFKLMENYDLLCDLSLSIEKALSPVVLLLLSSQTLCMYIALSSFVLFDSVYAPDSVKWQSVPGMTMIPASLIGVNFCAARILSKMRSIRAVLQKIHNNLARDIEMNWKSILLLKTMLKMNFPPMTAGGILELKSGLILSVFGSLLTYGLLIINIRSG
ncbi:hypothetical protein AVEN_245204-1 [Araneus ventricosus]|uniref:Gustatory receptor n=1 Tax=Araneus ventricosus TaxID=182803 RepID=A0A4Y2IL00_ARAVE|nr:hypothetical protein AVEN_245204-1 [Araneus ventricosus]